MKLTNKASKKLVEEIMDIVNKHNRVKQRENELHKLGYKVDEKPMGSGGVGQIKHLKDEIRVQIGYGHSRHNYAACVIIGK